MCLRVGHGILFCLEYLIGVTGDGIPFSNIFRVSAKLLDTERPVRAHEYVDAAIAFKVLEGNDDVRGHDGVRS